MKTTADYLDALRVKFNVPSDYALFKPTGWSRQHVSRYRTLNGSFDDATAAKVAAWLDIPLAQVLIDMNGQRAKDKEVKSAWESLAKSLATAAVAILAVMALPDQLGVMPTAQAAQELPMYIMLSLVIALIAVYGLTRRAPRRRDPRPRYQRPTIQELTPEAAQARLRKDSPTAKNRSIF